MKKIPLAVPNIIGNESKYLQECIDTTFVSSVGPFVDRFESMVSEAAGAKYAVATSCGTTGLHVSLVAVGVKPNDLVILPTLTFIASANAISHCGAKPWLFDVSSDSWCLDSDLLKETLKSETEKTSEGLIHKKTGQRVAAIMPVYILGMPVDMDRIIEIAKEYNLPIVADAAAAIGATYNGKQLGQLDVDLSVYSFNGNKTITCGGGGAVFGNNEKLVKRVKHLTTTARTGDKYEHDEIGFNYRLTNIQAAVGCAQLEQLDKFVYRKREIAAKYNEALKAVKGINLFPSPNWANGSCWFSGIVLDDRFDIDNIVQGLNEDGVGVKHFWKPMHLQKPYRDSLHTALNYAESIWNRILVLPCSTGLTDDEQNTVINSLLAQVN